MSDYERFHHTNDGRWESDHGFNIFMAGECLVRESTATMFRARWEIAQQERDALAARVAELEQKASALTKFYAMIWDRVDGALVLMPDRVDAFEKVHGDLCSSLADGEKQE